VHRSTLFFFESIYHNNLCIIFFYNVNYGEVVHKSYQIISRPVQYDELISKFGRMTMEAGCNKGQLDFFPVLFSLILLRLFYQDSGYMKKIV